MPEPRGRDCALLSASAAAAAAAKDAQQTMRGPAGTANRLNRRLNRRPPGTARRASACPAAAYPRRRALPAPGPRSLSAAAATSSARVSGSSAQRRRLRRLLPWWRSRLRSPLRRRRRRARDAAERTHWPGRGAGPRLLGNGKPAPRSPRAPSTRALPHLRAPASARRRRAAPPPAPTAHLGARKEHALAAATCTCEPVLT
ncbi:Hypothetical predicted protein [Marmota monax]|uniref:Uncharacterized protein n=1 Tax=Marmota monax TaxID=9995 RepID=A0A5E4B145_MARMO|nr:hypothetical protein GHT09_001508 [Marmota monax]VTJ62776.1 Hypothetical predicted protein [Marmota monax]